MKLKTIKLTFLLLFFSFNLLKADMTKDAFLDVGINSIREWSSCATNNDIPTAKYEEYEQVINDGWRHINIILCAHNDFPNDKLSTKGFNIRITNLRIQIEALLKKYPDIAFGISFKGYKPVGGTGKYGWDVKGIPQAILYKRIEDSPELQKEYLKWWRLVANEFKKIDRVAFTIMNEPEWHKISKGKKKWRKLSLEAIDAIREISPNRWIILEGINKSLIARDWTARGVMGKPVDRDKIIYGFHYYLTTNAGPESENNPKVVVKKINKSEYSNGWKALKSVIKYGEQYNVPVSVTEFGMTGLLEGIGGVDLNVRTDFVKNTIVKYMDACNECGLTWWALGDYNTPYLRQSSNKYQNFPRVPDQDLFEILKLKKKNNSNFSSKQVSLPYKKDPTLYSHKYFSSEEIVFLMTADGEDEKCIRDQFSSGLDLLRRDTLAHERYDRWEVVSVLKEIVKDCLNNEFSAMIREHENFSSEEIDFLMIADGEDEKCIRDQLGPGLDLLRKDTIYHKRYSRPVIYTWIKKIVKDCSN